MGQGFSCFNRNYSLISSVLLSQNTELVPNRVQITYIKISDEYQFVKMFCSIKVNYRLCLRD